MEKEDNTPHFENLSDGALRRYQAFFNLRGDNNSLIKSREELVEKVKNHFNSMVVDEKKVIETFLSIEKDQTNEKNNTIRKSLRQLEKNVLKFLDSLRSHLKIIKII